MVANGHGGGGGVGFFLGLEVFSGAGERAGKVRLILRTDSTANGGQEDPSRREEESERRTDLRTQQLKTGHRRSFEKRQGFRTTA